MKTYFLKEKDIYCGNLILVNRDHEIKTDLLEKDLEPFDFKYQEILLNKEVKEKLQEILKMIDKEKRIVPVSGFRSLKEQTDLYTSSIKENGLSFTKKYVAYPNTSEHQTGLAIDLGLNEEEIDFIRPHFPRKGVCEEFRKQAYLNGFIERYQKEKIKITKIEEEPWHFRYVSYPHSEIILKNHFCLEEYISHLKNYPYPKKKLEYKNYLISYLPYEEPIQIEVFETTKISGNNIDGFIITEESNAEK